MLPEIQTISTKDGTINRFLGLNQKDISNDEMFTDMLNMTSDNYPYLMPRDKATVRQVYSGSINSVLGSIVYGEDIYSVQNGSTGRPQLFKNFESISGVTLKYTNVKRQMVISGAYILIFPDNVMYNAETEEVKSMDTSVDPGLASFYLSDNKGRILLTVPDMAALGSNIRTNDTTITTYLTSRYGYMLPVCLEKETVYYDDSSVTAEIYPVGILLGDKSKVESYVDKTTYPVYWVSILSDNSISIEKYNKEMSMWTPIDLYNTYNIEYNHSSNAGFLKLKDAINEGDFIKIDALDEHYEEITEEDTNETYFKFIQKYRNRAKIAKLSIREQVAKNETLIDTIGFTFADPENLMLAAIRKAGNLVFDGTNNKKIIVDMYGILGFPYPNIAHLCDKALVSKDVPEMDFVTVCANRIWGCSSENHEIYSSKQGDFTSWYNYSGLASDSYAVTIPSGNPFTGAITYNDMPYFFTEVSAYSIMGNKPKNYQVQNFVLNGVEDGADKTVAQKDGYVYYKSKNGIERFNGNNSQIITEYLEVKGFKGYLGATNNDKYFVYMGKELSSAKLYVYDIKKNLWHIDQDSALVEMFELDNNLYSFITGYNIINLVKLYGNSVEKADILTDQSIPVTYDNPKWFVESGNFSGDLILNKYITKFMFQLKLEEYSKVSISLMYDDSGEWQKVFKTTDNQVKKLLKVPILVRRCERLKYKIEGIGKATIYSIVITFEGGSEVG